MDKSESIVVTLSGRGDKDIGIILHYLKIKERQKRNHGTSRSKKR